MKLTTLYLRSFRSYKEGVFTFSPGINYIHGENAKGKTNLLEAIYLLIFGRSFRTRSLAELISFGEKGFYVEAHFEKDGVAQKLRLSFDGEVRRILYNATPIASLSALFGILHGVILTPEDRRLVMGAPSFRREFLDLHLSHTSSIYLHHLSRYYKALQQRNHLLKLQTCDNIEVWESEMAESATFLTHFRKKAVEELQLHGHTTQEYISNRCDTLQLAYKAPLSENLKEFYIQHFKEMRPKELACGYTRIGPQRDQLGIFLQGREARLFASEGQIRSCVAALRFAEWQRLHACTDEAPLLCIDDVGSHLDSKREKRLYEELSKRGQVFLTSPYLPSSLPSQTHVISV